MALDGQLTYLSTESPPQIRRLRFPRRSPRLLDHDEEEGIAGEEGSRSELGISAPIIGYEVVDQRQKFTVYKIQVNSPRKRWFVFRRYTDFTRLNEKLQDAHPNFRVRLPGKRWFKDNFDPEFIEERARGLQFFINNLMSHSELTQSPEIHDFFCLNDPPGPYDSLEESRAYCQHLENQVEDLKQKVSELVAELEMTKSQLKQARVQQEALVSALQSERGSRKKRAAEKGGYSSLIDEVVTETERRSKSDSLRERVTQSLPQPWFRSISRGKMLTEDQAADDDKNLWRGSVQIAEHSSGEDRMRPSKLGRRHSEERRSHAPRTSTPLANSYHEFMDPKPVGYVDESVSNSKKELKESNEPQDLDSTEIVPPSEQVRSTSVVAIKEMPNEQSRKHSSKRDSGISIDHSPTSST